GGSERGRRDSPASDPAAAATMLSQLDQDRSLTAARIMAPKWYYPLNGFLSASVMGLYGKWAAQMNIQSSGEGWSAGISTSIFEAFFDMFWILTLIYVGYLVNAWRKEQIGADYDMIWGFIKPRNAVMWFWWSAFMLVCGIAVASVVVWVLLLQGIPDLPYAIATVVGAIAWFGEHAYDRYFCKLVERGQA
ncbi:hypothetical protein, partial [Bifidobacterium callitrichidarum]